MSFKRCGICQRFYRAIREDQKYCSRCIGKKKYYTAKPLLNKICLKCGKKFATRLTMQRFHSDKCRKQYYSSSTNKEKICRFCNNAFATTNSKKEYCCQEHYKMAKRIRSKKK